VLDQAARQRGDDEQQGRGQHRPAEPRKKRRERAPERGGIDREGMGPLDEGPQRLEEARAQTGREHADEQRPHASVTAWLTSRELAT
jgi:hypothetical protein